MPNRLTIYYKILQEIAERFFRTFEGPVDIQLYCTPKGEQGFDWHYDKEDVFVFQSIGEKMFYLIRNREKIDRSQIPDFSKMKNQGALDGPVIECRMKAGDCLYIPAGYWHKAHAVTDSFHLSVGILRSEPH